MHYYMNKENEDKAKEVRELVRKFNNENPYDMCDLYNRTDINNLSLELVQYLKTKINFQKEMYPLDNLFNMYILPINREQRKISLFTTNTEFLDYIQINTKGVSIAKIRERVYSIGVFYGVHLGPGDHIVAITYFVDEYDI